ncbi:hypothetical protein [Lacinutrix sp. Hel_I_90]|uniref:hypothetical protein n=1 Tax=Lacinutrix sp. Hel_I_90 TaxID=1249999 RepID=UPI000AD2438C|nr:hypothetical protein [Lacinutrix sp. Hel_I_90]
MMPTNQFKPKEAHYWESKHNKLVTLFKMGVATATGDQPRIGEEGKLNIKKKR